MLVIVWGMWDGVGCAGRGGDGSGVFGAVAVCGHLPAPGSVHALLARHRSCLFRDGMFEDLFVSGRGCRSTPGEVVAVLLLQALGGSVGSGCVCSVADRCGVEDRDWTGFDR